MYHDHHFHPFGYASLVNGLELMDAHDIDEVMSMVGARALEVDGPIIGQRLNDERVTELRLPTAADIDGVISERPVLLYRYCGHIAVANSAALALSGIDSQTEDPKGGSLDRDATGRPNGILRETAIKKVSRALAPLTPPPSDRDIVDALAGLAEFGLGSITGIVSVDEPVWCGTGDELETLVRIAPELPIDIDVLVIAKDPGAIARAKAQVDRSEGRARFLGWKEFSDGSLGGHTAAMHEPYADHPSTKGTDRLDFASAIQRAETSLEMGGQVAIHAIGDRANDGVLDLFEHLIRGGADPGALRVEHASVLTDEAIERMARLGVTASIQPAFLASEFDWLEKRLGRRRMANAYPFKSLLEAGVDLLGGSDTPVETPDPAVGITAAVDRHGINPGQALTQNQAEELFARRR